MRTSLKVTGLSEVIAELRNTEHRVTDRVRGQMSRAAKRVARHAQRMAPEDERHLVSTIFAHAEPIPKSRGRKAWQVTAGGLSWDGVDVDTYVMRIHETYDRAKMGKRTRAKQESEPLLIGAHFLTRAMEMEEQGGKLYKEISLEVKRTLKSWDELK